MKELTDAHLKRKSTHAFSFWTRIRSLILSPDGSKAQLCYYTLTKPPVYSNCVCAVDASCDRGESVQRGAMARIAISVLAEHGDDVVLSLTTVNKNSDLTFSVNSKYEKICASPTRKNHVHNLCCYLGDNWATCQQIIRMQLVFWLEFNTKYIQI